MVIPRGYIRRLAFWSVIYGFRRARSIQVISVSGLALICILIVIAVHTRTREQPDVIALAVIVGLTVALQALIGFAVVYKKERTRMRVGDTIQCMFGQQAFSARISSMRADFAYSDCKRLTVMGGFVFFESRTVQGSLILPADVFPKSQRVMVLRGGAPQRG
jgi:heme/copper-type cytochrome/quinol oxidase subunit 4